MNDAKIKTKAECQAEQNKSKEIDVGKNVVGKEVKCQKKWKRMACEKGNGSNSKSQEIITKRRLLDEDILDIELLVSKKLRPNGIEKSI